MSNKTRSFEDHSNQTVATYCSIFSGRCSATNSGDRGSIRAANSYSGEKDQALLLAEYRQIVATIAHIRIWSNGCVANLALEEKSAHKYLIFAEAAEAFELTFCREAGSVFWRGKQSFDADAPPLMRIYG